MNSKTQQGAIIERLGAEQKPLNKADHKWIGITKARPEVMEAFGVCYEAASMVIYGLIASGHVRALDETREFIDLDVCTIAELEGKPRWVSANELRALLRQWSPAPTADRDRVIAEKLRSGQIPGRNISWKKFCDDIRDKCNGWLSNKRPAWGFSYKQIQRQVKDLRWK